MDIMKKRARKKNRRGVSMPQTTQAKTSTKIERNAGNRCTKKRPLSYTRSIKHLCSQTGNIVTLAHGIFEYVWEIFMQIFHRETLRQKLLWMKKWLVLTVHVHMHELEDMLTLSNVNSKLKSLFLTKKSSITSIQNDHSSNSSAF